MARILTLTNWFPPHSRGGYEAVCHDVMARLDARGHQIEVLCSDELLADVGSPESGFPVHRRLRMYWRDGAPWIPGLREQVAIERQNERTLRAVIASLNPDVVSVWHLGALSLNLLTTISALRLPVVFAVHDDWLTYAYALDPWARRWSRHEHIARLTERLTGVPALVPDVGSMGLFTFVSHSTMERTLASAPWQFPTATVSVIPAGIDRGLYPKAGATAEHDWQGRLLYMGRLDPRKGIDTLLRALADLPEATLSLVGRGEPAERDRLMATVRNLDLADRVSFSAVERAQTAEVYLSHDCVVFPSEWDEPFGLVPLEAMACGVPVIATATGGTAEFLTDGVNCVRFPPGDVAALASAVRRLGADAGLRHELRHNGWAWADRYDVEHTADAYERLHLQAAVADVSS